MSPLTSDSLFDGRLIVRQEKKGYRFSLDAVLLAGLTRVHPEDRVVDLGTGCGVAPLIVAFRGSARRLVGIEIQRELAALAIGNVDANGFSDRIEIVAMDFKEAASRFEPECFDLAVSNPPYRKLRSGRVNPIEQKAVARHEIKASVEDVFAAAAYLLPMGGRLAVIYPASRCAHLMASGLRSDFSPKELTIIYSDASGPARLVHVEFRKGGGEELRIAPPFFIYGDDGRYTDAMQALYRV